MCGPDLGLSLLTSDDQDLAPGRIQEHEEHRGPDHVFRAWLQTRGCTALLWWESRYGKAEWWYQEPWISLGSHLGSCCCPVTTPQLGNADLSDMCNHLGPWWHPGVWQRPWFGPWLYHSLALLWCPWPKSSKNPGPLGCYLWPCRSLGNMSLLGPCQPQWPLTCPYLRYLKDSLRPLGCEVTFS